MARVAFFPNPQHLASLQFHPSTFAPLSPTGPTTPLGPNRATSPFFSPILFSISLGSNPCSSLNSRICRISITSRNRLPAKPLLPISASSASASSVSLFRTSTTWSAGLVAGDGNICGWRGEGPVTDREAVPDVVLKVEELEKVGAGVTGPIERRDRAKSGSAASRSTTTWTSMPVWKL